MAEIGKVEGDESVAAERLRDVRGVEKATCTIEARSGEGTCEDLSGVDGDKLGGDELDV